MCAFAHNIDRTKYSSIVMQASGIAVKGTPGFDMVAAGKNGTLTAHFVFEVGNASSWDPRNSMEKMEVESYSYTLSQTLHCMLLVKPKDPDMNEQARLQKMKFNDKIIAMGGNLQNIVTLI